MISIILLSLFATAFSSSCEDKFSEIESITIDKEVNYNDNPEHCPYCDHDYISIGCVCNEFKFHDHTFIALDEKCIGDVIYIMGYYKHNDSCYARHEGGNFVFDSGDISKMFYYYTINEDIEITCLYKYRVEVKIIEYNIRFILSIVLPICVGLGIIIIIVSVIVCYRRKK